MGGRIPREGLRALLEAAPYHAFLRVKLTSVEKGRVSVTLPFREEFLGDPEGPFLHGGIIAALLDIAACFAIISELERDVPTVDLRVDYLRPAGSVDITAEGSVVRVGRSLGVADAKAIDANGRLIAVGRGQFNTVKA